MGGEPPVTGTASGNSTAPSICFSGVEGGVGVMIFIAPYGHYIVQFLCCMKWYWIIVIMFSSLDCLVVVHHALQLLSGPA